MQYGGPDGELSASMRYLAQRYTMPVKRVGGLLTDIGTEELNHMEMICAMVYQLTKNLTPGKGKILLEEKSIKKYSLSEFARKVSIVRLDCGRRQRVDCRRKRSNISLRVTH